MKLSKFNAILSPSCNSNVISNLKKDVCIFKDEKDLREYLLDDYEAKMSKLQAPVDVVLLKSNFWNPAY